MPVRRVVDLFLYGGTASLFAVSLLLFCVLFSLKSPPRAGDGRLDWYDRLIEATLKSVIWLDAFLMSAGVWTIIR